MLTRDELEAGIDDDGTVDDPYQGIETYYCPLESIAEDEAGYLRITGDNGGTNVEIRVPIADLEANGWAKAPPGEGGDHAR